MESLSEVIAKRKAKKRGGRKTTPLDAPNQHRGITTSNVVLPDINQGGWSLIDQPAMTMPRPFGWGFFSFRIGEIEMSTDALEVIRRLAGVPVDQPMTIERAINELRMVMRGHGTMPLDCLTAEQDEALTLFVRDYYKPGNKDMVSMIIDPDRVRTCDL